MLPTKYYFVLAVGCYRILCPGNLIFWYAILLFDLIIDVEDGHKAPNTPGFHSFKSKEVHTRLRRCKNARFLSFSSVSPSFLYVWKSRLRLLHTDEALV